MGDRADDGGRNSHLALELSTERTGRTAVVSIRGELDAYTAPGLEELCSNIVEEGADSLVLDLSGTTFLDSSGLRAIVALHQRVEDARGELTLERPGHHIIRLLEITGLRDHFVVEGAPENAG